MQVTTGRPLRIWETAVGGHCGRGRADRRKERLLVAGRRRRGRAPRPPPHRNRRAEREPEGNPLREPLVGEPAHRRRVGDGLRRRSRRIYRHWACRRLHRHERVGHGHGPEVLGSAEPPARHRDGECQRVPLCPQRRRRPVLWGRHRDPSGRQHLGWSRRCLQRDPLHAPGPRRWRLRDAFHLVRLGRERTGRPDRELQ